ncbi:hypothetical protein GCM10010389_06740 [Streptomyces echinoruber]|uniref:Uncharacterized protein n=1 Tax=Streptomyces echinoruber TaxID=68898 RepID=A0A918V5P4_9ACTN|nr:hypothetical protein GCM10010389_06740 [Streptomyces echinoruber]
MLVADLDDDGTGVLQTADQLDAGAGVHDGVGDELADDDQGVLGQAAGEVLGAGHAQPGPLPQCRPHQVAGGAGRQEAAGQRRPGLGGSVATPGRGLPLCRNDPH